MLQVDMTLYAIYVQDRRSGSSSATVLVSCLLAMVQFDHSRPRLHDCSYGTSHVILSIVA